MVLIGDYELIHYGNHKAHNQHKGMTEGCVFNTVHMGSEATRFQIQKYSKKYTLFSPAKTWKNHVIQWSINLL